MKKLNFTVVSRRLLCLVDLNCVFNLKCQDLGSHLSTWQIHPAACNLSNRHLNHHNSVFLMIFLERLTATLLRSLVVHPSGLWFRVCRQLVKPCNSPDNIFSDSTMLWLPVRFMFIPSQNFQLEPLSSPLTYCSTLIVLESFAILIFLIFSKKLEHNNKDFEHVRHNIPAFYCVLTGTVW